MLRDLAEWVTRRPLRLAEDPRHVSHSATTRTAIVVFTGTDVLVALLIDAKLPPAGRAVHILWVLFSLTLCLGFCAMTARAPHLVDDGSLQLRSGPFRALTLPMAALGEVSVTHRYIPGYGLRRVPGPDEEVACSVSGTTHLVIELNQPVLVPLRKGGPLLTHRVYTSADDPALATRLLNQAIKGATP